MMDMYLMEVLHVHLILGMMVTKHNKVLCCMFLFIFFGLDCSKHNVQCYLLTTEELRNVLDGIVQSVCDVVSAKQRLHGYVPFNINLVIFGFPLLMFARLDNHSP